MRRPEASCQAMATALGVDLERLALLSVTATGASSCDVLVRIVRTAAADKPPSFAAADQFIADWHSHAASIFGESFPYTVDPDTPPTYDVLDTSDPKQGGGGSDDESWWMQQNIQAGIGAAVALVVVVAAVVIVRRKRGRSDTVGHANRDSTIYTYQGSPAVRSTKGKGRGNPFGDNAL